MNLLSEITPETAEFIRDQYVFFVATAPLSADGHLNLSPKGLDCFRIISPTRVGYLDLTGSGNETAAHISENGRIVFMFCAFAGKPNILRLYGRGNLILPSSREWPEMIRHFTPIAGARQIILCDVDRVQNSCGMAVPLMQFQNHRDGLVNWAEKKGPDGLSEYRRKKNTVSIDGIPIPNDDAVSQV